MSHRVDTDAELEILTRDLELARQRVGVLEAQLAEESIDLNQSTIRVIRRFIADVLPDCSQETAQDIADLLIVRLRDRN